MILRYMLIETAFLSSILGSMSANEPAGNVRATAQLLLISTSAVDGPTGKKVETTPTVPPDLIETHMLVIGSPAVVTKAVKKHRLDSLPSLQSQKAVETIAQRLKVARATEGRAPESGIMTVSYEGPNGEECLKILGAIIEAYQDFAADTQSKEALIREAVKLLDQSQSLSRQLSEKENAYRKFRQESQAPKSNVRQSDFQIQDEQMRGEIDRLKRLFDTLVKKLEDVNLIKDYGPALRVYVISPPTLVGQK